MIQGACDGSPKGDKRESGANPGQSRCCKLDYGKARSATGEPYALWEGGLSQAKSEDLPPQKFHFSLSRKEADEKDNMTFHDLSRIIRFRYVLTGQLLCASLCATAQHDSLPSRERTLDGVTVVSRRSGNHVEATKPLQQLNREDLQILGLENLADAVKKFAGAQVKDYGGIGGMKTVSVRNLGAHHTAVSYDDVTVSNTQAGQIDIGRFTLDNVESVSLSVGNEDNWLQSARHYASAGVLNIKSEREGRDDEHLEVTAKGASFGYVSPSFRYWQPIDSSTTVTLHGSFARADGIYPFTLVNGMEKTEERRHNSDIQSWQGEANLYHHWGTRSELAVKGYWFYSERGLPGAVVLYVDDSDERLWDEDFFTQAVFTHRLNDRFTLKARLKYTHTWNRYEDTDVKYKDGKQTDVARQNEYYTALTMGWRPADWLTVSIAEDLFWNDLRNNITISDNLTDPPYPKRTTSLTALSASAGWQRLHVNAHVVGTLSKEHVEAGATPPDRHKLTPSLSLSYQVLPREQLYVRAMYKQTFRLPTFNDLYYLRMGNTGLRPENAHELNAGVTWCSRPMRHLRYVSVTVDGYLNNVTDKIVAFPSTYVWKMANFGKVRITGLDLTLAADVPLFETGGGETSLQLTGSYSHLKAEDREHDSRSYGKQIPYTPRESGAFSAMLRTPWLHIGYNLLTQGKRWSNVMSTPQYLLKAYTEHSVSVSRELKLRRCRLLLQGTVHNLTDAQYEIIKYYPMPGRSYSVSATVGL